MLFSSDAFRQLDSRVNQELELLTLKDEDIEQALREDVLAKKFLSNEKFSSSNQDEATAVKGTKTVSLNYPAPSIMQLCFQRQTELEGEACMSRIDDVSLEDLAKYLNEKPESTVTSRSIVAESIKANRSKLHKKKKAKQGFDEEERSTKIPDAIGQPRLLMNAPKKAPAYLSKIKTGVEESLDDLPTVKM